MTTAPSARYVKVDRNIHFCSGKYRVLITRRPKNVYGGRFAKLSEAKEVRDRLETQHVARPAGSPKGDRPPRTTVTLRLERRAAGLCQVCGDEPPAKDCVTCRGCMDFSSAKRRAARQERALLKSLPCQSP